jgi:hypothetical protein
MRLTILAAATLGLALISTAASAAVAPTRVPTAKPSTAAMAGCSGELGMLRAVDMHDVMAVDFDNTIVIRTVCQENHLHGNAVTLTGIIGRNEAMSSALDEANVRSDDVVGIYFGDNGAVLLYVMQ